MPERTVLLWTDQVLDALEYLHGQRPEPHHPPRHQATNLVLTAQGKIKLVDFGLVKLLDPSNPSTATSMKGMGTPEYAPLEQYGGAGHTDARSDIYALGATLYHLLTGMAPAVAAQRVLNPRLLASPRQLAPGLSASPRPCCSGHRASSCPAFPDGARDVPGHKRGGPRRSLEPGRNAAGFSSPNKLAFGRCGGNCRVGSGS